VKRSVAVGLVAAAVLAVAAIATSAFLVRGPAPSGSSSELALEPESAFRSELKVGDEVFAVEPEIVVGIDYETPQRRISAERPSPNDRFVVSVKDAQGRELTRCQAGKSWDSVLPAFTSVRALRVLSATEARALWGAAGKDAAILRVRDTIAGDPTQFRVVVRHEGDVVLRDGGGVFVSSLPERVVGLLRAGCAGPD